MIHPPLNSPIDISLEQYLDRFSQSDRPLLLDFWASWCVPCMLMKRGVAKAAELLGDTVTVGLVNVDEEPGLVEHFGVRGTPTFLLVVRGEVVGTFVGLTSAGNLERLVMEKLAALAVRP